MMYLIVQYSQTHTHTHKNILDQEYILESTTDSPSFPLFFSILIHFITCLAHGSIWVGCLLPLNLNKDQVQTISIVISGMRGKEIAFWRDMKTNLMKDLTQEIRPGEFLTYIKRIIFLREKNRVWRQIFIEVLSCARYSAKFFYIRSFYERW